MIFAEIKVARTWTVDDDMPMDVALELIVFPTRKTVYPSAFGTDFVQCEWLTREKVVS